MDAYSNPNSHVAARGIYLKLELVTRDYCRLMEFHLPSGNVKDYSNQRSKFVIKHKYMNILSCFIALTTVLFLQIWDWRRK